MATTSASKRAKISLFESADSIASESNPLTDAYLLYTGGGDPILPPPLSPPDSGIVVPPVSLKPTSGMALADPLSMPVVTAPSNGTSHLLPNGSISPLSPSHTTAFLPSFTAAQKLGSPPLMNSNSKAASAIQNESRSQLLLVRQIPASKIATSTNLSAPRLISPKLLPSNAQLAPRLAPVTLSASPSPSFSSISRQPTPVPMQSAVQLIPPAPLPRADPEKSAVQLTSEVFEYASSLFSELGDMLALASEHLPDTQQQLTLVRGPGRPRGLRTGGPGDALFPDVPGPPPPPPPPPFQPQTPLSTNAITNPDSNSSASWYPAEHTNGGLNGALPPPTMTPTRGRARGRGGRPPNSARWAPEELDLLEVLFYFNLFCPKIFFLSLVHFIN